MRAPVIEGRGLTVRVGDGTPVREVSFALAAGEIGALRGVGATALLEAAAGVRRPVAGEVRVAGADPYDDRSAVRSAAVWRDGGLFPGLTVAEVVDTWRRWTLDPLTRAEALRLTGLTALADEPFERLTPLRRRLLDLALALVGRSDVLFLEEPTAGLGAADADRIRSVLRYLAAHGVTILLATSDAEEAAGADREFDLGRAAGRAAGRVEEPGHAA